MELKEVASVDIGTEQVAKYYPILFQITEQDKRATYYLEDLRAWADGDVSGIAGMERHVIMGLAQAVLRYTELGEAANPPPEGMRRIERREDNEDQL